MTNKDFLNKYSLFLSRWKFSPDDEGRLAQIREVVSGHINGELNSDGSTQDRDNKWRKFSEELRGYLSQLGWELEKLRFIPIRKSLSREYRFGFFEVPVKVSFEGEESAQIYFSAINFSSGFGFRTSQQQKIFLFGCKIGGDGLDFKQNSFAGKIHISNSFFSKLDISGSSCDGDFVFEIGSGFNGWEMAKSDDEAVRAETSKITLDEGLFKGRVLFRVVKGDCSKKFEISANHAVFESPVVFDIPFAECPDFSKARFLKGVFIEETWEVDVKNIKANDRDKFRFLKNYFAGIGDHFREQKYFNYEMRAAAKGRPQESEIENDKNSNFFKKVRQVGHRLLFGTYALFSDYGMNIVRPFIAMMIFAVVFGFIYLGLFGCGGSASNIFAAAFLKTLPTYDIEGVLCSAKDCVLSNPLRFAVFAQTIISTILLFLFGLGIRNRFKIK